MHTHGSLAGRRPHLRLRRAVGLLAGSALCAGLLVVPVSASGADGTTFSDVVTSALLPAPQLATDLVTADVDLDGIADVLVSSHDTSGTADSGMVSVFRSGGADRLDFPAGRRAYGIAAGDLDGDGLVDVVTTTFDGMNVLRGNGDGTFDAPVRHGAGQLRQPVTVDVDADGDLDVAAANYYSGSFLGAVDVLRNDGNGAFALSRVQLGAHTFPTRLTTGDLDLDGRADLLATNNGSFYVLLGNGDGSFAPPVHHTWSYTNTFGQANFAAHLTDVSVGDFDGDGLPDVAASSSNDTAAGLWFFPGRGDGTLARDRAVSRRFGEAGEAVAAADVDGDGRLDVAVASGNGPRSPALLDVRRPGDPWPSLGFQGPGGYVPHMFPGRIAVADVDGDGRPDLLTLASSERRLLTRLQSVPPPPPPPSPTPPEILVHAPAANVSYEQDLEVLADYQCFDDSAVVTCSGPVPAGSPIDTSVAGPAAFRVSATDDAGASAAVQVEYEVTPAQPPTIEIVVPQQDGVYEQGADVWLDFVCDDGTGSGVRTCDASTTGWSLDTGTVGVHTFTVTATDLAGHRSTRSVSYEVVPAGPVDTVRPTVRISSPLDGSTVRQHATVLAQYDCEDLESGIASCSGPVASGSPVSTSVSGYRTFQVTAVDNAGNVTSSSVSYFVEAGPPPPDTFAPLVLFTTPSAHARYATGSTLEVDYTCFDYGTGATGVASCTGTHPDGAALDTSTPGMRSFSVTTSDTAGNTRTTSITYEIIDDRDGDGIRDLWESQGIDIDQDGTVDLPLHQAPYNADPDRRDLFLEMDFMTCTLAEAGCAPGDRTSHAPQAGVVQDTVAAFAAAPVTNFDGSTGITLHYTVDEAVPEISNVRWYRGPGAYDDVEDVKSGPAGPCNGSFGTAADRADPATCEKVLRAKNQVYRWGLFGHFYAEGGTSSGIAEYPGNDFMVTVGGAADSWERSAGSLRVAEAATVMHEMGHTLGLGHGGPQDDVNCKPNYLSVMNYSLTMPYYDPTAPLDYSRAALPTLDEAALDENLGVQGPAGRYTVHGVSGTSRVVPADGPVDWDGNGTASGVVSADVNSTDQCFDGGPGQKLTGADDWANLHYSFYSSPDYAAGARTTSAVLLDEEVTAEEALAAAESVDFDGDGHSNAQDVCPAVADPAQADLDGDGIGDACDEATTVGIRILPEPGPAIRLSQRFVRVAVLSTARLAAVDVSRSSLRFGARGSEVGPATCVTRDANADRRADLVCSYPVAGTGLTTGSTSGTLTGRTTSGVVFTGSGALRVVR